MIPTERPVPDREGPRDECGVFGVYAPGHDVARLAYFGLYALQHRGQESAGIATCEGGHITTLRDTGLVSQVFDEEKLRALEGDMAIGHVRYSTTGGGSWENTQPVWRDDGRELALAHNGNLTNAVELYNELRERGLAFRGTSDSEIIAALLSVEEARPIENAVEAVMPRLAGRLLDGGDDQAGGGRLPRSARRAAALARQDRRPLLRRLGELRLRHHRRRVAARGDARRADLADRGRDRDAAGGALEPPRPLRLRAHLLLAAGHAAGGPGPAAGAGADGRDPLARVAGGRRPGDLGARLGQPRGERLRAGLGHPPGRRADQEPLRGANLHPAGAGAAQARPANEVQPAAGDRRRQARRRGRRLDRARQHDPPDRRHAEGRRGEGGAPADLVAADPPSLPLRDRHVDPRGDDRPRPHGRADRRRARRRLARLPVDGGGLRGDRGSRASTTATPASPATTRSATAARGTASSRSRTSPPPLARCERVSGERGTE